MDVPYSVMISNSLDIILQYAKTVKSQFAKLENRWDTLGNFGNTHLNKMFSLEYNPHIFTAYRDDIKGAKCFQKNKLVA